MGRSDTSYSAFKKLLGPIGLLALLYPRTYVNYGGNIAYTDESTPEWKPWDTQEHVSPACSTSS